MNTEWIKSIFEDQEDVYWLIDSDLKLLYGNAAYRKVVEELSGKKPVVGVDAIIDTFPEEYKQRWQDYYKKVFKKELNEVKEHIYNPATSQMVIGHIKFHLLEDDNGQEAAILCHSFVPSSNEKLGKEAEQLIDASLDVICSIDSEGRFIKVSSACTTLWGYSPEELAGKPYMDLIHPDDVEKTKSIAQDIIDGVNVTTFENRYVRKDGQIAYNLWSARYDDRSNIMFCIARDGSDKISKENLLLESEHRFKALVQEGSDLIGILDEEGNYKYVSPTSTAILGIPPDDFIGKNAFDFIHPEDKERTFGFLTQIFDNDNVQVEPFRFQNSQGEWRWIETVLTNMLQNTAIKGIVANSRDITDKIEEQQRLRLFEKAINNSSDAIIITEAEPLDEPGPRIIFVNEAFTKMTGYTAEEVIGQTPRILQGTGSDKSELRELGKKLRNWESSEITVMNYTKQGKPFWVNLAVSPVADQKGWYTHWVSVQREVTEKKKKEWEKELLSKISLTFNEENDYLSACQSLCSTIGEFGQFDWVELWTLNIDRSLIQHVSHYLKNPDDLVFYEISKELIQYEKGQGLPGCVWESKKQLFWDANKIKNDFIRWEAAIHIDLNAVLGIPIFNEGEIIGVLIIGIKRHEESFNEYANLFSQFHNFIGGEIARKQLEDSLLHLHESIPDVVCVADFQGRCLKMNRTGRDFFGYSQEELLDLHFEEFVFSTDQENSAKEIAKLTQGQSTFSFEKRYVQKNSENNWLSWTCKPILKERLIYATARNITQEKKLRELRKVTTEMARIGSWEVDLINNKLFWSEMVHQLHETDHTTYEPALEEGINFYREDFREMVAKAVNDCIQNDRPFDFEAIIVTAKKKEIWVRAIGRAEFLKGKCIRVYGSFQDIHERKMLESTITEILASISDAFYALDQNWCFTYFNKEAENLLSRKGKDVLGKSIWDTFPAAKNSELETVFKQVTQTQESVSFEYLYPDNLNWYEVNVYPFKGGVSVYFKNIDERKQAEKALNEAFTERNSILESIGDAFFAVDQQWIVTYWNKEAEKVLSRKKDEIIGKNLWEVYHDAIGLKFYTKYHQAMNTGKSVRFEEFYPTLKKWFEVSAYPSERGLSVYFKDITLRKETDLAVIEANQRFEKVTEVTTDAIWDWDIVSDNFYRGKGFEQLFGYEVNRFMTEQDFWQDSFHPEDLPRIKKSIENAIRDKSLNKWEQEYRIVQKNGLERTVVDKATIVRDKNGIATRMIGAITDITLRKQHEQELLELNKHLQVKIKDLQIAYEELEQFSFIASHDLQEPLRMVSSFLEQLKRKYSDKLDDKALQYIHFATDGAKRMKTIILDLLEYSRAGKFQEAQQKIDLNLILEEYALLRQRIIQETKANILFDQLPNVNSYKAPLTQVIHSLLDNGIKYSRPGVSPKIEIKTTESDSEWTISVTDNGIGIKSEFFDQIFIIFQRLHNRDDYEGTGIGLSIVKKQVESWGGSVWLESEVGVGSTFYFTIPKDLQDED